MAVEIERKFLLRSDDWRAVAGEGVFYRQGYLVGSKSASVRVRMEGSVAFLNIKSATLGIRRSEFEYPIPADDAEEMLANLCQQPLVEKVRYHIKVGTHTWEIDEFRGQNAGLVVAEVELTNEQEKLELPAWVGEEVSNDPRYYNVKLVTHPYREW